MAFLLDLSIRCDAPFCKSRAAVKLIDFRNEERGRWCRAHGKKKLAERERFEAEQARPYPSEDKVR